MRLPLCAACGRCLRAQPGVDPDGVGVYGHSEGGWVVLRAAGRTDPAYVVTTGCPAVTPAVQERFGLANVLRNDRVSADDVETALASYDRVVDAGRRDADLAEAAALLRDGSSLLPHYLGELDEPTWQFLKRKQHHDPIPDLRALECSCLALFGGADRLVPVAQSVHQYAAAACRHGRAADATMTVAIFPGADHRVRTADGGFAPGYLQTISSWISDRVSTR